MGPICCGGPIGPIGPICMPPPIIGKPGPPMGGGTGAMGATAPPIAIAPGNITTAGVLASATIFGRGLFSSAKNNSRTNGSDTWTGWGHHGHEQSNRSLCFRCSRGDFCIAPASGNSFKHAEAKHAARHPQQNRCMQDARRKSHSLH